MIKISLEAERYFTKHKLSERHEAFKFNKKGDLVSWTNDYGVE